MAGLQNLGDPLGGAGLFNSLINSAHASIIHSLLLQTLMEYFVDMQLHKSKKNNFKNYFVQMCVRKSWMRIMKTYIESSDISSSITTYLVNII